VRAETGRLPWTAPKLRRIPTGDGVVPDGALRVIVWHVAGRLLVLTGDLGRIVADVPLPDGSRDVHHLAARGHLARLGILLDGEAQTSDGATVWRARREVQP
jgi:hypothetical protein